MRNRLLKNQRHNQRPGIIPADYQRLFPKLEQLEQNDQSAFFALVLACRNPNYVVRACRDDSPHCRQHHQCRRKENFLGLVKHIDHQGRAKVDPTVREIVLACTPSAQMPRLVPLANAV